MPFISKDWRSPGEEWVKTQEGWEKKKVLECTAIRICDGEEGENTNAPVNRIPPHCRITVKCTKEIAGFNGLSEAVRRLDFTSAVRDVRRFNYICALLELLLRGHRMMHLPGSAQKLLLSMVEHLADQVAASQQNLNSLRCLGVSLAALSAASAGACWGRALGSAATWRAHRHHMQRLSEAATHIRITEPGPEVTPKLHDLPEECIKEIILRLSDHKDIESASAAWCGLERACAERRVWARLVRFHFASRTPPAAAASEPPAARPTADWKKLFHQLRKQYGLREDPQLAETLSLCRHCKCLFWRSLGHPCIADQCPEYRERVKEAGGPLPVPPAAFLEFFSL